MQTGLLTVYNMRSTAYPRKLAFILKLHLILLVLPFGVVVLIPGFPATAVTGIF